MPQPISSLTLYNCRLERTGHKTIDFASASARDAYFSGNSVVANICFTAFNGNATYIREHDVINVGISADALDSAGVNYCRFINPQAGNFFRYAFIDQIEYVAPETSRLHIRVDAFVSNIGNINLGQCFVEREHVADDTRGLHTLPETIATENMVCNSVLYDLCPDLAGFTKSGFNANYYAAIFMTEPTFTVPGNYDSYIGGNANCSYIIAPESIDDLGALIDFLTDNNLSNAIIGIIPLIRGFVTATEVDLPAEVASEVGFSKVYTITDTSNSKYGVTLYSSFGALDGYTPHNNKLYTYPYNYIKVMSASGAETILEYEKLPGTNDNFIVSYSASLSPTLSIAPEYYNGVTKPVDKIVSYSQFSPIAYTVDTYSQWYAQNKNVVDLTLYTKAGAIVRSGFGALSAQNTQQALGAAGNVLDSTVNAMQWLASVMDMQRRPDEIKGTLTGNALIYQSRAGVKVLDMCIKGEYAEIIDRYFDCYGYNVSITKTPQINSRPHYNYCKTVGSNVYGAMPEDHKEQIDRLFNDGITVWHISSGGSYGTYDANNAP